MVLSITVDVEEWFHSNWFNAQNIISKHYNGKEPVTDVLKRTNELANLFNEYEIKGTFFVLGETAKKYPEIIELLESSPNELACHGFYHNKVYTDLLEFKKDLQKFKKEISSDLNGFRFPNFDYSKEKLEIIAEEGFKYDSSVVPCLNIPGWYGNPSSTIKPYCIHLNSGKHIFELPLSVLPYLRLPGGGGWFLRNLGYLWTKTVLKLSLKKMGYGTIYIHPWEISDKNPKLDEISFHVFRNTGTKTLNNLKKLIENFLESEFISLADQHYLRKNG